MLVQFYLSLLTISIPRDDFALAMSMKKPTFEATFYEENEELDILLHEPEDVKGDFGGFEVLMRIGSPILRNPWYSEVNLTAAERECRVEGLIPLLSYSVTVRGLVLPDKYSELADPLIFEVLNARLSAPQNVKLEAVDAHTVNMTWDPPAKPNDLNAGYTIEWSIDDREQKSINVSSGQFYAFTELKPQVPLSASICAHYKPNVSMKFEYVGSFSKLVTASTPPVTQAAGTGRSTSTPAVTMTKRSTPTHANITSDDKESTSAPAITVGGSNSTPKITMIGRPTSSPSSTTSMETASTPPLTPSTISASNSATTKTGNSTMVPATTTATEPTLTPSFTTATLAKFSPPTPMTSGCTTDSVMRTTNEPSSTTEILTSGQSTLVSTTTPSKSTSYIVATATTSSTLPTGTTKLMEFESSPLISTSEPPASSLADAASEDSTSTFLFTTANASEFKPPIVMTRPSTLTSVTATERESSSTPKISSNQKPTFEPGGTTSKPTLISVQTASGISAPIPAIRKSKRHAPFATVAIKSPTSTSVIITSKGPASTSSRTINKKTSTTPAITTTKASARALAATNTEDSPSIPMGPTTAKALSCNVIATGRSASVPVIPKSGGSLSTPTFITPDEYALNFAISAIVLKCTAAILV